MKHIGHMVCSSFNATTSTSVAGSRCFRSFPNLDPRILEPKTTPALEVGSIVRIKLGSIVGVKVGTYYVDTSVSTSVAGSRCFHSFLNPDPKDMPEQVQLLPDEVAKLAAHHVFLRGTPRSSSVSLSCKLILN